MLDALKHVSLRYLFIDKLDHLILLQKHETIKRSTDVKIKWKWLNTRDSETRRDTVDYESKGRGFESRRAHQRKTPDAL